MRFRVSTSTRCCGAADCGRVGFQRSERRLSARSCQLCRVAETRSALNRDSLDTGAKCPVSRRALRSVTSRFTGSAHDREPAGSRLAALQHTDHAEGRQQQRPALRQRHGGDSDAVDVARDRRKVRTIALPRMVVPQAEVDVAVTLAEIRSAVQKWKRVVASASCWAVSQK